MACEHKDRIDWNLIEELAKINGKLASLKLQVESTALKLMFGVALGIAIGVVIGMILGNYTVGHELGNLTKSYTDAYTQGYIQGVRDSLGDPIHAAFKYVCLSNQTSSIQVDGVQFTLTCNSSG